MGQDIAPTIFTGVSSDMIDAREKISGPVLTILPFDTVKKAVAMINDTEYGLAASVWTKNIDKA